MAATPNTGKTHGRYLRMLINGYNLRGDMRSVSSFGVELDQDDATGWSDDVTQYLAGRGRVLLDGFTAIFNNEAASTGPTIAGAHTVLSGATEVYGSVFIGIRSVPAIGNPAFSAVFEKTAYSTNGDAVPMIQATLGGSAVLPSSLSVWGHVLAAGTELTGTTAGASVDGGASSTGGYIAFLHVTQTAGAIASNDWAFVVEHSSNDSTWATLATFTADGSSLTAERLEGSGTVNRYVRLNSTRTAGTARPWVTFIRK